MWVSPLSKISIAASAGRALARSHTVKDLSSLSPAAESGTLETAAGSKTRFRRLRRRRWWWD